MGYHTRYQSILEKHKESKKQEINDPHLINEIYDKKNIYLEVEYNNNK